MTAALAVTARRVPVAADAIEQALALLDTQEGAYFGCDAGIAGMHPLQASLVVQPLLALQVFADGVVPQALAPGGAALLAHAALAPFVALSGRGRGAGAPVEALRCFHTCMGHAPEVLLLGAFGFSAHRLAAADVAGLPDERLGVLYFSDQYFQRDAAGRWMRVELTFGGLVIEPAGMAHEEARADTAVLAQDDFPPGGYASVVANALVRLRDQPLVSLTLSQSFRRAGTVLASAAFARLRGVNPAPASFFVNAGQGERFFGASPDLQLAVQGRRVEAFPVCGTVARGRGPVGEAESFRELVNEDVDAASLAVCSDALRNDLAPLCEPGSLRLMARRRQLSLSTVVHTVDQLRGLLRPGADAWDAIVATAAPVMVTGTPRRLALPLIDALEGSPRGWYGGLMVQVAGDGSALVGTILRAAVLRGGTVEVRCGGDLMADSDPPREERESRLKALSLWRALGMEEAVAAAVAVAVNAEGSAWPAALAVRLQSGGDPFAAAVTDVLLGLGCVLRDDAAVTVLAGDGTLPAGKALQHTVALGDAAARVLAGSGFAMREIAPAHGRVVRCTTSPDAPWQATAFNSARYATLAVDFGGGADLAGWQVWARDDALQPVVLAHGGRRVVCLLMRPESLMSDDIARMALQASLVFASTDGA